MSAHIAKFADLVEMIDRLPLEQRENLVEIVRRRNADDARSAYRPASAPRGVSIVMVNPNPQRQKS